MGFDEALCHLPEKLKKDLTIVDLKNYMLLFESLFFVVKSIWF